MGLLSLRWRKNDGNGIAQLHNVIDEDFDEVSSRCFELHLREDGDVRGVQSGVLENKFDLAFP